MTGEGNRKAPEFLLSCAATDALRLGVVAFDPNIETIPPPAIHRTVDGNMSEADAAKYLSYRMCRGVSVRTMRRWRDLEIGPMFYAGPRGKPVWYRQADLDEFLAINCERGNHAA